MSDFKGNVLGGDQSRYDKVIADIGFENLGYVLDEGCGYGQWSRALSRAGNIVTGRDIDEEKLQAALDIFSTHEERGIKYVKWDMRVDSWNNIYDAIFSYSAIYWAGKKWPEVLENWYNALKPGGKLYFTTDSAEYFIKHPAWAIKALHSGARPMNIQEVRRVMNKTGFTRVEVDKDPFYGEESGVYAVSARKPS